MSAEDIAGSHEELLRHGCVEIKKEKVEVDEKIYDDEEDIKDESNLYENDLEYNPKISKSKKTKKEKENNGNSLKKVKNKKRRPKKHEPDVKLKVETNEYPFDEQNNLFENSNLELSEQFIEFILNQVDVLCETIKNGDPDIIRTLEVNQKLNDAVDCYRIKLDPEKQIFDGSGYGEFHDDIGDFLPDPNLPEKKVKVSKVPKVPKKKRKSEGKVGRPSGGQKGGGRPRKQSNDEKFELVRNQCGRHKIPSMAVLLNMAKSSLHMRIKEEGLIFTKTNRECKLCEMEKNTVDIKKDALLSLLRFNREEDKFECSICGILVSQRPQMYDHIREKHTDEINTKGMPDTKPEPIEDCDGTICKKVYGSGLGKKYWCKKCSLVLELASEVRKEPKVCPECGLSVHNLTAHLTNKHYKETHLCSFCPAVFPSLSYLNTHKKSVHEKVPCTECGKLFGIKVMKRHIESAHTPDDQKKCRCDICGKGFSNNQRLAEHLNIHTGEKPYECQYCSARFASRGTHAGHERGHTGKGRKIYKQNI